MTDRHIARLQRITHCPVSGCDAERKMRGPADRAGFRCGSLFGVINGRIVAIAACRSGTEFSAKMLNLECGGQRWTLNSTPCR